jgi:hypothetical protein
METIPMIFEQSPFNQEATAREKLGLMMMGYRMTQLVYVAAELRIADQLSDGPRSAAEIAGLVGVQPGHLFRVLRALATIGVFDHKEDDIFALNPLSELLRDNARGSVRDYAIRHGAEWSWLPWGALLHSVRTGETAFDHALGLSHWEYMARHPHVEKDFGCSMAESTTQISAAVLDNYDFPERGLVVDVGGGHGALLTAILEAYPAASGMLFDQAGIVETARSTLAHRDLLNRCQLVAGDFFSEIPVGGDVYILHRIIHDWDDERAVQILRNCRMSMGDRGRLLIIDRIMPEASIPSPVKIVDVTVMVLYGTGRERTEQEFRQLLAQASLRLVKVHPLRVPASLIEAAGYWLLEGAPA